ncbi:hypothetical protein H4J50_18750 [Colwellia sp. 6M3]|jgi:hypothetical protein|uniref:hypothetical protein n=1 Tax=Colwellia sp. 6M3 TaxID=2759849 RepID=UPI0015F7313A|nr:hypothetical protein [Colwellia sp. 6M3]MBA6418030.1 hypothetical protein [Colwellia sp. 6M3]|tara:strand:- start:1427 stop:1600 length:174 start_codon:yes stop_codon:yes gene_type:complete
MNTIVSDWQIVSVLDGENLIGSGYRAEIQTNDFDLLRHGFSPEQIKSLNLAQQKNFH